MDSGANQSILGEKGLDFISSLNIPIQSCKFSVTTADGTRHKVLGHANLPVELESKVRVFKFLVVPSVKHSIILGVDFLESFHLSINFADKTFNINSCFDLLALNAETCPVNAICEQDSLSLSQKSQLDEIISGFKALSDKGLGKTHKVCHKIDTGTSEPIKQRHHPISPAMQVIMNKELDRLLAMGIVRESNSPWASPVLLVKKPNGEYRLCLDSRKLNSVSKKCAYPLPFVSSILDKLRDARFLTSIDLRQAFYQIPLEESSCEKTAFVVQGRGLYEFVTMPFGLHNAAQTQQKLMDMIFPPHLEPFIFTYLDDICIATPSFERHITVLKEVFKRLNEAGLTVNIEKCSFCRPSLKFLGYVIDKYGLRTDPEKVSAIVDFPVPKTTTEIKRFIGLSSWYRRFLKNFSSLSAKITELIKGKKKKQPIVWSKEADAAFIQIKNMLVTAPVLASPNFELPFVIATDASDLGLGAVLSQFIDGQEHVIAYASRGLSRTERNYSVTERELLAIIFALEKFRPYVEGAKFKIITDHYSLLWINRIKEPSGRLARWAVKLQQFDFDIEHRKGSLNVVADALSRAYVNVLDITDNDKDNWYIKMINNVSDSPQKYPSWRVENGNLFKYIKSKQSLKKNFADWKLVVPENLRKRVLTDLHDDPTAAHLGIYKTFHRVAALYYWPKMKTFVTNYVNKCKICQASKVPNVPRPGFMGKPKSVQFPFQIISIDLMGYLPRSTSGNTFLLVITDWLTKYVLMHPLRNATASSIVKYLENEVFLVYGVPQIVMADNGAQFTSREFKGLLDRYKVPKLWYNAKFHPQVNFVERTNKVIGSAIRSYVHENHRTWDKEINKIAQAIRTARSEVTGYSPSFLTFGRYVPISGEFYGKVDENFDYFTDNRVGRGEDLEKLPELFKVVRQKMNHAFKRNEKRYNLRKRPLKFKVGDRVWKRNYVLSSAVNYFSSKLAPKYIPCIVTGVVSPLVYVLEDMDGHDLGRWHIKDLKPDYGDLSSGSEE